MRLFRRENYLMKIRGFYHADDIIKVITGVRRCGKSCLLQVIAEELQERGVSSQNIIYLDLDKRGYKGIRTAEELEALIEPYEAIRGTKYLFIDEVQNVDRFEEVINGFRTDGGWSIFITGSNSYLLSGELMTKLTGRYLEFEMFPLSLEEYLQMKAFYKMPIQENYVELNRYILEGGFPRTLFFENGNDKAVYVQGIVNEIFEKDIRRRVKIRDKESFEAVRKYILNNYGATTNINNLCNVLRENGMKITRNTMTRYVQALLDAKILYECTRFDMKSKKSLCRDKKYYIADLSFYYSQNTDNRVKYGPTLENILFVYLKSKDYSVSVGRIGKFECDFIVRGRNMMYSYIQVAYTIADSRETEDREYRPLETVRDNYPKYVVTTDFLLQQRNGICHVNLMEHLRQGKVF